MLMYTCFMDDLGGLGHIEVKRATLRFQNGAGPEMVRVSGDLARHDDVSLASNEGSLWLGVLLDEEEIALPSVSVHESRRPILVS